MLQTCEKRALENRKIIENVEIEATDKISLLNNRNLKPIKQIVAQKHDKKNEG